MAKTYRHSRRIIPGSRLPKRRRAQSRRCYQDSGKATCAAMITWRWTLQTRRLRRVPPGHTQDQDVVAPLAGARPDTGIKSETTTRPDTTIRPDTGARLDAGTGSDTTAQPGTPMIPHELMAAATVSRLPALRVVGQLSQSYIVTEGPDGMYLIDQHPAHERILLERMVAALQARTPLSQLLLAPIKLELAPAELGAIEDHLQQLEHIGFALEVLEDNAIQVQAVPNVLTKQMNTRSLHELLAELTTPENPGHSDTS